jgi:CRISPR-associated protein Cas2
MLIWVIYDISDDKRRNRIAKSCKEYGLYRIQKSVFLGDLPVHCADEIAAFSRDLIDEKTDAVFILPCCEPDFSKHIVVGKKEFDEALVQGTKKTLLI